MGRRAVQKPKRLAEKLLTIRQTLGLSQFEMARLMHCDYYHRLSEFENGRRVPNLLILLSYAKAANVPVDSLIDDDVSLPFGATGNEPGK